MGLLSKVKVAALFGCLLFVSISYAGEDYAWTTDGNDRYGDPGAACRAAGEAQYANSPTQKFDHTGEITVYFNGYGYVASCQQYFTDRQDPGAPIKGVSNGVSRVGTQCASGTGPFDPLTGTCTSQQQYQPGDKCTDQTGGYEGNPMIWDDTVSKCVNLSAAEGDAPCSYIKSLGDSNPNFTGNAYEVAGTVSGGTATAPPTFAQDGLKCVVATVSTSNCKVEVDGTATCSVIGKLTGKGSSTGTKIIDALCQNGTCDPQEPETKTQEQPCVPSANGSGGSGCTQTKETVQDGSQQCGQLNGAYKCVTKQPYSNGITTNISSTSQTLPDGSVKVTTVKDSSNTVCTDVKTCTTKTSTTTTHTTTKPNGSTTTDTSCKGTCTNNGGGLETNTGAGSGNPATGNGNGGNGNGEGGDGTASTTDDCAATPPCDGDPFSCAILKQNHIDTCKLMADATAEQKAAAKAKTDAAYAALDAHQTELDNQANGLLSKFQSDVQETGTTGKCLPDKVIPLGKLGTVTLELSKYCDSLVSIRYILLAVAYMFAARVVFREV